MKIKKRIVSSDMKRENRIPPGQVQTRRFPVLHYGPVPGFEPESWDFRMLGGVRKPRSFTLEELLKLDRIEVHSDIHCVTTWSLLDNVWEGVAVSDLIELCGGLTDGMQYVIAHAEYGFTTNLPLKDFLEEDVLVAFRHNGAELSPEHGYPLRLVVPRLYFWKSAKWLRALEFSPEDKPGFWERNGYHNHGDPWTEERTWI